MVAVVWIHMGRVVLHGSYKPPRQMNWILGVGMLVATMLLAYTGYVLPWDRLGVAAATIGENMLASAPLIGSEGPGAALFGATAQSDLRFLLLGGREASGPTLVRFYALHCSWLPTILGLLSMLHFWKVRKDGGFSRPL
jgi:quinol-cytochrome oxidoreductase complex cytochrome b subunit